MKRKKAMEGRGCPRHSKLSRYDLHAHLAVVGNFHHSLDPVN